MKAVQLLEKLEASVGSAKATMDLLNGLLVLITLDVSHSLTRLPIFMKKILTHPASVPLLRVGPGFLTYAVHKR